MAALWTLNHVALNKGWTARASEYPTVGKVKDEAAFRATHYMLLSFLGTQGLTPPRKTCIKTIKTFLNHKVEAQNYVAKLIGKYHCSERKCPELKV